MTVSASPTTPLDLYIAAVAEVGGATLLRYDRHFDAIARVTDPGDGVGGRPRIARLTVAGH